MYLGGKNNKNNNDLMVLPFAAPSPCLTLMSLSQPRHKNPDAEAKNKISSCHSCKSTNKVTTKHSSH